MAGSLKGLRRIPDNGVVAGVLAGIAEYFDWNVRVLRVIAVVGVIFTGFFPFIFAYLVLWYVMDPVKPGSMRSAYGEPVAPAPAGMSRPATSAELRARFAQLEERLGFMEECVTTKEFELRRELKKLEADA